MLFGNGIRVPGHEAGSDAVLALEEEFRNNRRFFKFRSQATQIQEQTIYSVEKSMLEAVRIDFDYCEHYMISHTVSIIW